MTEENDCVALIFSPLHYFPVRYIMDKRFFKNFLIFSKGQYKRHIMDIPTDKDKLNIQEITLFKDSPVLGYIYKKTEKLVSAIYMLSNFISDKEPIKWQMRESGINLLSLSLSLSDRNSFLSTALKLLSFLEISYVSGTISEMNYKVLKFEFESLIETIEAYDKNGNLKGLIFSDHFFEVPVGQGQTLSAIPKGHNILSDRLSDTKPVRQSNHLAVDKSNRHTGTDRQEIILSLLRKNKELGIKDFTVSISDCSEKTIQRELVAMVSKGLIKKEGEKRWSRYLLK
jgi:hypothetical protein